MDVDELLLLELEGGRGRRRRLGSDVVMAGAVVERLERLLSLLL